MSVININCTSREMARTARIVGKATGGVMFGKGMDKVNWKLVRAMCNFGYTFMPSEKGVKIKKLHLGSVYGDMSLPKVRSSDNIILYIHGGGLVSGSAKATRSYCSMLAKYSGMRVVSIDYALAPEHTYPSALDDCHEAYSALRQQYPDSKICVTGESAGGYLTMALTVRLINRGEKLPECLLPQSPLTNVTGELKRDYYEIHDNTVQPDALPYLMAVYCPGEDLYNPEISVLHSDKLAQFPPTMISCDANETLREDAEAAYKTLSDLGVETHLVIFENSFHACSTAGTGTPETLRLLFENIQFVRRCFGENLL